MTGRWPCAPATPPVAAVARAIGVEPGLAPGTTWAASSGGSVERLSSQDGSWNEQHASVRRYFARGSLGLETMRAERFGRRDHAWALDACSQLWKGAYANLRFQHAPLERLFPGSSWRAELYQGIGSGWEMSVSKDRLGFDGGAVDIHGFGLAKYIGNFYLSARRTRVSSPGLDTSGHRLVARYYYKGDADSYAELSRSRGRGDDMLTLAGGRQRSDATGLAIVSYWNAHWNTRLGASHAREGNGIKERSIALSLGRRW